MEPNEFVDKQIELNKDVVKVMQITRKQTELQNEINRNIATHVDNQAARIKSLEQLVYVTTVITFIEIVLIAVILTGK
jgi:hypothetical protein